MSLHKVDPKWRNMGVVLYSDGVVFWNHVVKRVEWNRFEDDMWPLTLLWLHAWTVRSNLPLPHLNQSLDWYAPLRSSEIDTIWLFCLHCRGPPSPACALWTTRASFKLYIWIDVVFKCAKRIIKKSLINLYGCHCQNCVVKCIALFIRRARWFYINLNYYAFVDNEFIMNYWY